MAERRLDIEALGARAEGMARLDGADIAVPFALPGETVMAEVNDGRGRLLRVERPSPARVAAFCTQFGTCGGCQLQHWDETPYRAWKRGLVEQALRRRGIDAAVADLVDAHGAGRRRASLHVRKRDGLVTAGFMALRSHSLVDIDRCPALVPELAPATDIGRALGQRLGDLDVALTATGGGIDAAVRAERRVVEREQPKLATLAAAIDLARLAVNGEIVSLRRTPAIAMGPAQVVPPAGSFLQATAEGEFRLAALVMAALGKPKAVADLFCGCGPFAFRLAQRARVAAYDTDRQAIAALAQAARATPGLKPIQATARDLFREPLTVRELAPFDTAVFDPPRAGAEAQCRTLAKSAVGTVIAVSCDPQSFARDAAILASGGYALRAVTPVDQFKWTSHVEIVARFQRSPLR